MNSPLLKTLDAPIAFHRSLVEISGSFTAAAMLGQAIYWANRTKDPEGWFYKSHKDWNDELGLSRHEVDGARRKLLERGLIEEDLRGVPAKMHYRVIETALAEALSVCRKPANCVQDAQFAENQQTSLSETRKLDCRNPANKKADNRQTLNKEETTAKTTYTEVERAHVACAIWPDDFAKAVMDRHMDALNEEPSEERIRAAKRPLAELQVFLIEVEDPDPVETAIAMADHLRRKIPSADWAAVAKHRDVIWQEIRPRPRQTIDCGSAASLNGQVAKDAFEFQFWPVFKAINDDGEDGARPVFVEIVATGQASATEITEGAKAYAAFCSIARGAGFVAKAKNWLKDGCWKTNWAAKLAEWQKAQKPGQKPGKPSKSARAQFERLQERDRQRGTV